MSDALQALYQGDEERARQLLPPDGELSVFEAAALKSRMWLSPSPQYERPSFTPRIHVSKSSFCSGFSFT